MIHKKIYKKGLSLLLTGILLSCSEFVAVDPPRNEISSETVFTDDASATSAILGIYSEMSDSFLSGSSQSIDVLGGLSADEFRPASANHTREQFYHNNILPNNSGVLNGIWQPAYRFIYYCNSLLEGLENAGGVTMATKRQLEGEARFIRGLCYFYLVNLFGEVPIITTTDFEKNRLASRVPITLVYEQIQNDLETARELLPEDYSHADGERIRPNRIAAAAMLARISLFKEDWSQAEALATSVMENHRYSLVAELEQVFLANNKEAIWQIKPTVRNNTPEAQVFMPITESNPPLYVLLTSNILNAFEEGDNRRTNWIGSGNTITGDTVYYPFKYKIRDVNRPSTEYSTILRLAEQYLIRAEARIMLGNKNGAREDINTVRTRAGLEEITTGNREELLNIILRERQVELFSEGAHRWLDLKRTGLADMVLGSLKPEWQATDILFPVPQQERESNPNLSQNTGY